jgi:uncharacterized membrane protein YdcZ (DUF606 family)
MPVDQSIATSSRIWLFAFGYFACYAPYSALTKALTQGMLPGRDEAISGFELLPSTLIASVVGMYVFITAKGWWKYATHSTVLGRSVPRPTRWTFLSGLCTAAIIATTTLAYTFEGVSIVFVMLLMRGGVLIIAPVVDSLSKRKTHWFSWAGLLLSLAALLVAFSERGGYDITLICAIDVAIYLLSYFIRLRFMSGQAKSTERAQNTRFFVEEQMVASPAMLALLAALALINDGAILEEIRAGFTTFWSRPIVPEALVVGFLSQGTGIFGGLILLDPSENTYSVPVNRCSSILAGVVASYSLVLFLGESLPSIHEIIGAILIIVAILFLTVPPMLAKRRAAALVTSTR